MPRIAVLSDVHANRQALDAVMRAMRRERLDGWWCLGDLVGYGGDPLPCLRTCVGEAARCLAGNHDLAAAGRIPLGAFADWAYAALRWTHDVIGDGGRTRLAGLLPSDPVDPVPLFHASPRDPVWEYVTTAAAARDALGLITAPLAFIGHTHVAAAWRLDGDGLLDGGPVAAGTTIALEDGSWLVNPGAVGQPRDGDARAAWAVLDHEAGTVTFHRTPYDVAGAQNAILAAGLPPLLASRLSEGR